jgi:hypothetical protein
MSEPIPPDPCRAELLGISATLISRIKRMGLKKTALYH